MVHSCIQSLIAACMRAFCLSASPINQGVQDRWNLQSAAWARGAAELLGFGQAPAEELYLDKSRTPAGMGTQSRSANAKKEEKRDGPCSLM
ncbi:hypothetical protein Efla_006528 [Eimeria flavescens]